MPVLPGSLPVRWMFQTLNSKWAIEEPVSCKAVCDRSWYSGVKINLKVISLHRKVFFLTKYINDGSRALIKWLLDVEKKKRFNGLLNQCIEMSWNSKTVLCSFSLQFLSKNVWKQNTLNVQNLFCTSIINQKQPKDNLYISIILTKNSCLLQ